MYFSKVAEGKFIIRLKRTEKVNESLKKFCEEKGVENGYISAIGSIEDPVLAHYQVNTKKYSEKHFKGIFEVACLIGTIGLFEEKPLVHPHIVISDESMKAYAGHLVEATVSATLEIVLEKFNTSLTKTYDEEIGLKLYDLGKEI